MVDTCSAEFGKNTLFLFYARKKSSLTLNRQGWNLESFGVERFSSKKKEIIVCWGRDPSWDQPGYWKFDYCCVHGFTGNKGKPDTEAIIVNYSLKLCFYWFWYCQTNWHEPVFTEHLWEIVEHERQKTWLLPQLGGQTASLFRYAHTAKRN